MPFYGLAPVNFDPVSGVTATIGGGIELGTRIEYEGKALLYDYKAGNSQALPGHGVTVTGNVSGYSVTISSVTMIDAFVGVVHHSTIPTGYYGWVVTRGLSKVRAPVNSIIAAGSLLTPGGDGVWTNNSVVTNVTAPLVQGKITLDTASAGVGEAIVSCLYY